MQETEKIYSAIHGVISDIGAITKEKKNTQGGYMYRGVDDVMNALQPALIKNKLFIVPTVKNEQREERASKSGGTVLYTRLTVEFRFFAEDGSNIVATVIGEAMDSGDKATNKALSVAYKYACFQVFCIPTDEADDADREEPQPETLYVDSTKITVLREKLKKKGVKEEAILERYHCDSIEKLTVVDFMKAMSGLEKTPDAKAEPDVDFGI